MVAASFTALTISADCDDLSAPPSITISNQAPLDVIHAPARPEMLPHLEQPISDGLYVPRLAVLCFFQAAGKTAMRQPILEAEQSSLEFIGVFNREHDSTATKRLQIVNPRWPEHRRGITF